MDLGKIKSYLSNRFDRWLYREFIGYDVTYYGKKIPIPDYKYYDRVHEIPELTNLKNSLAHYGLKDPWIRNHTWRYGKGYGPSLHYNLFMKYCRGWKQGLFLALCYSYYCKKAYPNYNTHHHDGLPMTLMHIFDDPPEHNHH